MNECIVQFAVAEKISYPLEVEYSERRGTLRKQDIPCKSAATPNVTLFVREIPIFVGPETLNAHIF